LLKPEAPDAGIGQGLNLKVGTLIDTIPLVINRPVKNGIFHTGLGPNMYFELLDASKNIFVIGFK
jgi:hypothetical protein